MGRLATAATVTLPTMGAILVVGVQTPPEVAASNAAAWVEKLTGRLPNWSAPVDQWLTLLGVLMVAVPVAIWIWRRYFPRAKAATVAIKIDPAARPTGTSHKRPRPLASMAEPDFSDDRLSDEDNRVRQEVLSRAARSANEAQELLTRTLLGPSSLGIPWPKATKPKPQWIPLHEALHYLVYDSRWGAEQSTVSGEGEFNELVRAEICEHLARGEIFSRGRRGWGPEARKRATEKITEEFWVDAIFYPFAMIALAEAGGNEAGKQGGGDEQWSAIIVDQAAVWRVWPPRQVLSGAAKEPTRLAAAVEGLRVKIAEEAQERVRLRAAQWQPLEGPAVPSFEASPEFDYTIKTAIVRAELGHSTGEKSARDNKIFHVAVCLKLKTVHSKQMDDCSVFLTNLVCNGVASKIDEALMFGDETSFTLYPQMEKPVSLMSRDVSDTITPQPFLVRLASRIYPLEEGAKYVFMLELRSRYRFPTRLHVQVTTGKGTALIAKIIKQDLSETPL